ncbi:MAG: NUDIX domain-containing protein [Nitrososphaerota archaeon]|nr:NUDIX domain-containing protein [Nitrososphaerota archaeon]
MNQIYPEPTVGALVQRDDGKVLLCDSHKWPGLYTVPGGHVELGETCEEALVREIKEEVGLDIRVVDLVSIQQVIYPREFWKKAHFIFFDFLCKAEGEQQVKVDANEIQDTIWAYPKDALNMNVDRYLRHFLLRLIDKSVPFSVTWK